MIPTEIAAMGGECDVGIFHPRAIRFACPFESTDAARTVRSGYFRNQASSAEISLILFSPNILVHFSESLLA